MNECQIQCGTTEDMEALGLQCCLNGFDAIYDFNMSCSVLEDIKDKVLAHVCIYKHNLFFSTSVHLCTDCIVSKACIM